MRHAKRLVIPALALCGAAQLLAADVVIRAARVFDGHEWSEAGVILVRDGRIAGLGVEAPSDEHEELAFERAVITPGLVDAMCAVDSGERDSVFDPRDDFAPAFAGGYTDAPDAPNGDPAAASLAALAERIDAVHAHESGLLHQLCEQAVRVSPDHPDYDRQADQMCVCGGHDEVLTAAEERLASALVRRATWGEQSAEVTPHLRVIDGLNLYSSDFERLARSGVTTVFVSPDSSCVIGARGAIVKTAGRLPARIVREADAVKAALGQDPSRRGSRNTLPVINASFYMRRPTTRMGVDFVFRKAFSDAARAAEGLPLFGADQPPRAALPVLRQIVAGELPLRIQARLSHDIFSALELTEQLGIDFVLEEATEADECLAALAARRTPVIFGPIYMQPRGWRRSEVSQQWLDTPARLAAAGVPFALTAQEFRDEEGLVRQAMCAARYGLDRDRALRAITSAPAELMNVGDQVGTLAVGSAADLVVWSGDPLAPTSRPLLVMIDGEIVHRAE